MLSKGAAPSDCANAAAKGSVNEHACTIKRTSHRATMAARHPHLLPSQNLLVGQWLHLQLLPQGARGQRFALRLEFLPFCCFEIQPAQSVWQPPPSVTDLSPDNKLATQMLGEKDATCDCAHPSCCHFHRLGGGVQYVALARSDMKTCQPEQSHQPV